MSDSLRFVDLRYANRARGRTAAKFKASRKWSRAQWGQALVGELGELANILKKVDRRDLTIEQARSEVAKELADVQTYLDRLADACGVDLGKATIAKFNEVSERVGSNVQLRAGHWLLGVPPQRSKHGGGR